MRLLVAVFALCLCAPLPAVAQSKSEVIYWPASTLSGYVGSPGTELEFAL